MNPTLTAMPSVTLGEVAGTDARGAPLVRWDAGAATAALAVWMRDPPDWARCHGLRVALAFVDGEPTRPVILALLDAPPRKPDQTLRIASEQELVIECGKSKIALRADGRIEIRGGHLISRASGPNKVKGGSVFIN